MHGAEWKEQSAHATGPQAEITLRPTPVMILGFNEPPSKGLAGIIDAASRASPATAVGPRAAVEMADVMPLHVHQGLRSTWSMFFLAAE